jgi:hypothetical protein
VAVGKDNRVNIPAGHSGSLQVGNQHSCIRPQPGLEAGIHKNGISSGLDHQGGYFETACQWNPVLISQVLNISSRYIGKKVGQLHWIDGIQYRQTFEAAKSKAKTILRDHGLLLIIA